MNKRLKHCHSIEDVRTLARRRLPKAIFDFIDGGANGENVMLANRDQFEAYGIVQRVGVDVSKLNTARELLGRRFNYPLGIGPTGLAGLAWPAAELALMRAAEAFNVPFTLSTVSSIAIEEIGAASTRPHWFQLYILRDRAISWRLMERAAASNFETLVVTLDCPVGGQRERDLRNRFSLPYRPPPSAYFDTARRISWLLQLVKHGVPEPRNMEEAARNMGSQGLLHFMESQLDPSVTWKDVQNVRSLWKGRLVIKGILSPEDVAHAINVGADGVIISNHGGRQHGAAPRPLFMLPQIVDAACGRLTVILDSGIRRGTDVLKALALGADGVLMGRPTLYGVGAAGEAGARRVLELLTAEVEKAMSLSGCPLIDDLGIDRLVLNEPPPLFDSVEQGRLRCVAEREV